MELLKKILESNLNISEISYLLQFGKPKIKKTIFDLRNNGFLDVDRPVFFLSTGRCGTKWMTDLLQKDKGSVTFHQPLPDLAVQSKFAFEILENKEFNDDFKVKVIQELFLTAREQYLRYSVKTQKRYIETNNYISFFAFAIAELIPSAKFVHIVRHPASFVRSGLRRGYYDESPDDIKRIEPVHSSVDWSSYSRIQKISWLWANTNKQIEDFKNKVDSDRHFFFDFDQLSLRKVQEMLNFLEVSISDNQISSELDVKKNVQKQGSYLKYEKWEDKDKSELKNICLDLAMKYNYEL